MALIVEPHDDESNAVASVSDAVDAVAVQEVLESIAETAFKASDFPLILSFENHCSYVSVSVHHIL